MLATWSLITINAIVLNKNMRENLCDLRLGQDTHQKHKPYAKVSWIGLQNSKLLFESMVKKINTSHRLGKCWQNIYLIKGLYPESYMYIYTHTHILSKHNNRNPFNPIKQWVKIWKSASLKKMSRRQTNTWKDCQLH